MTTLGGHAWGCFILASAFLFAIFGEWVLASCFPGNSPQIQSDHREERSLLPCGPVRFSGAGGRAAVLERAASNFAHTFSRSPLPCMIPFDVSSCVPGGTAPSNNFRSPPRISQQKKYCTTMQNKNVFSEIRIRSKLAQFRSETTSHHKHPHLGFNAAKLFVPQPS